MPAIHMTHTRSRPRSTELLSAGSVVISVSSRIFGAGDSRRVTLHIVAVAAAVLVVICAAHGEFALPQTGFGWLGLGCMGIRPASEHKVSYAGHIGKDLCVGLFSRAKSLGFCARPKRKPPTTGRLCFVPDGESIRQSSAVVATSREGHRQRGSGQEGQHRRLGRGQEPK
jgi:hypothetical protein